MNEAGRAYARQLLKEKLDRDLGNMIRGSGGTRFEAERLRWLGEWLIDHFEPERELVAVPPIITILKSTIQVPSDEDAESDAAPDN